MITLGPSLFCIEGPAFFLFLFLHQAIARVTRMLMVTEQAVNRRSALKIVQNIGLSVISSIRRFPEYYLNRRHYGVHSGPFTFTVLFFQLCRPRVRRSRLDPGFAGFPPGAPSAVICVQPFFDVNVR